MRTMGRITMVLCLLALAAAPGGAGDKHLPPAVARAVEENRPGAQIAKLEIEEKAGLTLYDIEFKGGQGEIEVAEDGTVLDVTTVIPVSELPAKVGAAIRKLVGEASIKKAERSEVRARIDKQEGRLEALAAPEYVYEAELSRGGEIEVSADGTILKAPKWARAGAGGAR